MKGTGRTGFPMRAVRAAAVLILACGLGMAPEATTAQSTGPASVADSVLLARVEAALATASDLPPDSITVSVAGGVVTLAGSVVCGECGGTRTPSGSGTVQQSLGAVVRAVPGVERVLFDLVYRRP